MNSGIYCIHNLVNNKKYIGQTVDLKRRKYHHRHNLKNNTHFNPYLQNAWNKYGEDNFEFFIIQKCPVEQLDDLEKFYIFINDCLNEKYGYNMMVGGSEGYCGELNPNWKNYPRIIKKGFIDGKQVYVIIFNSKILKKSLSREKLEKMFNILKYRSDNGDLLYALYFDGEILEINESYDELNDLLTKIKGE